MLTFLTGGARSGKSSIAVNAAARRDTPVTVIANSLTPFCSREITELQPNG